MILLSFRDLTGFDCSIHEQFLPAHSWINQCPRICENFYLKIVHLTVHCCEITFSEPGCCQAPSRASNTNGWWPKLHCLGINIGSLRNWIESNTKALSHLMAQIWCSRSGPCCEGRTSNHTTKNHILDYVVVPAVLLYSWILKWVCQRTIWIFPRLIKRKEHRKYVRSNYALFHSIAHRSLTVWLITTFLEDMLLRGTHLMRKGWNFKFLHACWDDLPRLVFASAQK